MVPEIIRYRIPQAQASAFEESYSQAAEILQQSEECLGYELVRCVKDRDLYLLIIRWKSASAHLEGFRRSGRFPEFFGLVKPFLPNLLEMEHYESTPLVWDRSPSHRDAAA